MKLVLGLGHLILVSTIMLLMVNMVACGGLEVEFLPRFCGLTFTSYGFDVSSYYKREEDSFKPECSWIFDGIGADEVIGDLDSSGVEAGLELDR